MSYMVGREEKRTNDRKMLPALKNNAAAGYKLGSSENRAFEKCRSKYWVSKEIASLMSAYEVSDKNLN